MFCVIRKIVFIFAAGNDKSHITMSEINQTINLHVSVDCVLIGFDGEQFRVLLVRQVGKQSEDGYNNMKLPGSLIYDDEDLDEAAKRVLNELTGLKNVNLHQCQVSDSHNAVYFLLVQTMKTFQPQHILRVTGTVFRSIRLKLGKIDRRFEQLSDKYDACWTPVTEVKSLAFDHFQILQDALVHIRHYVEYAPSAMFDLLPRKFTAAQLRTVYQLIYDKVFDVRNFHKKIALMPYVVPLEEKQVGVCHRAAQQG